VEFANRNCRSAKHLNPRSDYLLGNNQPNLEYHWLVGSAVAIEAMVPGATDQIPRQVALIGSSSTICRSPVGATKQRVPPAHGQMWRQLWGWLIAMDVLWGIHLANGYAVLWGWNLVHIAPRECIPVWRWIWAAWQSVWMDGTGHGWWTGCVVDYMLEGTHDKPFCVWIGDDVQPVNRAGVSLCFSEDRCPVLVIYRKTAGVCWRKLRVLEEAMCYHFILNGSCHLSDDVSDDIFRIQ
jgi:hypothetical protein